MTESLSQAKIKTIPPNKILYQALGSHSVSVYSVALSNFCYHFSFMNFFRENQESFPIAPNGNTYYLGIILKIKSQGKSFNIFLHPRVCSS